MRKLDWHITAGGKRLRCGYTTGTCAAAATRAACDLLLQKTQVPCVEVETPSGIRIILDVEEYQSGTDWAQCAIRKDAGDDPDVTDGVLVFAKAMRASGKDVRIDGGTGVGRITLSGLDQPVGAAAINSTPRAMIAEQARASATDAHYTGGLNIEISIPAGVELAKHTFNPRLGIEGGISVLGTSGIVKPMSEEAIVSSIELELSVMRNKGVAHVLAAPGNYGFTFAEDSLGLSLEHAIQCSNHLGATIDAAVLLGFQSMLVVGHIGKMAKVAGGAMNTHSRVADARMEVLAAHAALSGAEAKYIATIMEAATTEAALDVLEDAGVLVSALESLTNKLAEHLAHRTQGKLRTEAIIFSNQRGVLGKTEGAHELAVHHTKPALAYAP